MGLIESAEGFMQNFQPGNLFGQFSTGPLATVYFFGKVIFMAVVFAGACLLFWKFWLQYNVKLTIWRRVGAGWEAKDDRGKVVVDKQGKRKIQLFFKRNNKKPITCPVPSSQYLCKKGKKDHYVMFLDDNCQLHPFDQPELPADLDSSRKLIIRPQERDAWASMERKLVEEKFKKRSMMELYLPAGIMITASVCAFLLFFFASKELGAGLSSLASQFSQVAASCTALS